MAPKNPKAKRWCYTLNNYETEPVLEANVVYHVYGREVGDMGTKHLQGFIIFDKPTLFTQVKQLIPTAHWEITRGKNKEAADYCKKDGDIYEYGEMPKEPGSAGGAANKRRYEEAFELAKEGKLDDIPRDLLVRHYRTMKQIKTDYMTSIPSTESTTGLWYYGESGVGKSYKARTENPGSYLKMCNKWWDGYQGEETVIMEDFDKSHACLSHHLKIWSDKYDFLAEVKSGTIRARPKKFIITSQYKISDIWDPNYDKETYDALNRRFEQIEINPYFQ